MTNGTNLKLLREFVHQSTCAHCGAERKRKNKKTCPFCSKEYPSIAEAISKLPSETRTILLEVLKEAHEPKVIMQAEVVHKTVIMRSEGEDTTEWRRRVNHFDGREEVYYTKLDHDGRRKMKQENCLGGWSEWYG